MLQNTSSDKDIVNLIVETTIELGIKHVILSPGSRNAPLIIAFANNKLFNSYSIIDERSAAYYALGMAKELQQPVAIVCTSGTAALNYAPALAEAFYQEIPIVAITADRPSEWIDHEDGQTIHQANIFNNYIKQSLSLPDETLPNSTKIAQAQLTKFVETFSQYPLGPAHINVPLTEPLYNTTTHNYKPQTPFVATTPQKPNLEIIKSIWEKAEKVMIVVGFMQHNNILNQLIGQLATTKNCVVIAPPLANIDSATTNTPESVILNMHNNTTPFTPNLLITLGNAVVSKQLKFFLRKNKPQYHIDIDLNPRKVDTYRALTHKIIADSNTAIKYIIDNCAAKNSYFVELWTNAAIKTTHITEQFQTKLAWSDFYAFSFIFKQLAQYNYTINLHLANSTPVRFADLFPKLPNVNYYCNRGTNGIEGCLSTAAGGSLTSPNLTLAIIGDVSFFYDSNCFYNNHLNKNFKVVVINNGGGNIFNVLGYTSGMECANYFTTPIGFSVKGVCDTFSVQHFKATTIAELQNQWQKFIDCNYCSVLEIDTHNADNTMVLKDFFSQL